MNKWIVRSIGGAIAAGAIVGGWFVYQHVTRPPELTFRTTKVDRGSIVARVTATGTLSAHVTVQVGSQVSGRLSEISVDFNSTVKKNQIIARLDPALFQAALASARANSFQALGALNKSKAQVEDAQKKLDRAKALRAEGLLSQADLDTAVTAVNVAKADVEAQKGSLEQARAQEHQADINLQYCTIISPIDGTVISRNVDVGQTVAASLQAPTLFTIAEDLRKMQVDTNVTEGDVGKLKAGMKATFIVDAYANERFTGTIQQIRNAAQTVQNVVTYDAVIEVENPDLKLRPGMTANATIVYDRRESALRVPNGALRFRPPPSLASAAPSAPPAPPLPEASAPPPEASAAPAANAATPAPSGSAHAHGKWGGRGQGDSSSKTVWVMRGGKLPTAITVKTGLTDGSFTEVVSGDLQEGDAVVLEVQSSDEPAPTGRPAGGGNQTPRMRL